MELKIFTVDQLAEIIRKHGLWLADEDGGERADLSSANLSSADLSGADLRGADLSGADLFNADLSSADLRSANLRSAKFQNCNLAGASGILSVAIDLRGYNLVRWFSEGGVKMYNAGCQCLTFDEALAHWGDVSYANAERGALYVSAVRWLDSLPVEEL